MHPEREHTHQVQGPSKGKPLHLRSSSPKSVDAVWQKRKLRPRHLALTKGTQLVRKQARTEKGVALQARFHGFLCDL